MAKRKKAPTKKAKSGIKRRRIVSGIGLISSINCTPPLKTAFEGGIGITPIYKCNKGYRGLEVAVEDFNGVPDIGVIVTVGGLIAYNAANSKSTKPFVSLVGMEPSNGSAQYRGCVNLQMYIFNPKRIAHLVDTKGFQRNQIYLFYNPNSATANDETREWRREHAGPVVAGTTKDDNDEKTYPAAFNSITDQTAAVVISADPFFYDTRRKLIDAANRWVAAGTKRYVCYPLQNYGDARPTKGAATLYGPTLEETYRYLGELAAHVLREPTRPVTFMRVPLGDPVVL